MVKEDWHNLFCCVSLICLNVGLWVTGNYTPEMAVLCGFLLVLWIIG
jgi:hypothetical protein